MNARVMAAASLMVAAALAVAAAPTDGERYRPHYHFSPRQHWTNDPNGLVYFEGEYHLFFQYNPFGDKWGHMSWGHAVSRDLIHWEELPVALREENGIMIFTGSTVVDENNSSGFCSGGKPCLVAVYTGHTPEHDGKPALQTQNLAYSNDRGRTWTKYSGNPVLDLHMSDYRDPKAFWSTARKEWVMVVALPNDHKVLLYHAKDLKHWQQMSEFGPAGATGGQWECPELFEIPVEGKPGDSRWVLKVGLNPGGLQGGSGEQYFVGKFDGTKFINENSGATTLWTDYGKDCYCALTFNHLPQTARNPLVIGWMDNWQYAADLPTAPPWRGQMTVPRRLALRSTSDGLRLTQDPVSQLDSIRSAPKQFGDSDIKRVNAWLAKEENALGKSFESELNIGVGNASQTIVTVEGVEITYDRGAHTLSVDRRHAGAVNFNEKFPASVQAPLNVNGNLKLELVVDGDSLEVFAQDGLVTLTNLVFPDRAQTHLAIKTIGGAAGNTIVRLWTLQ